MTSTSTTAPPRRLVQRASLSDLVVAYATGSRHPFALSLDGGDTRVICPRCGFVDHNGGSARVLDAWRWFCWRCRRAGTRYHFERVVQEDAVMLEALYELVQP